MQFGGGNFLRAFVDWMVQELNEVAGFNAGVVVVKPTESGDYTQLKSQDGLFHVVLDGLKNGHLVSETVLVTTVSRVVDPYTEWDAYLALAHEPQLRFVVSNTTEAGIRFNEKDGYNDIPPKEFPAKLTLWLYKRFEHFGGDASKGCILLPCELIEKNGSALKQSILDYALHWGLSKEFAAWLHTANFFCNTLVDRIVSGYPADRATEIQEGLQFTDSLLVAGEQYHSWVIQANETVKSELPFDKTNLNVTFVSDLEPYHNMKVRLLNGAHTAMVPVAYLAGLRLVSEAMQDAEVGSFVLTLLLEEVCPTLHFPEDVKQRFVLDVLNRFKNPTLKHQLISISLNGSSKFVSRLLPTLKDYLQNMGSLPQRIVFSLACMIRFYKGEANGLGIPLNDAPEVLALFAKNWTLNGSEPIDLVKLTTMVLAEESIWGENLNQIPGLTHLLAQYLLAIETLGAAKAIADFRR